MERNGAGACQSPTLMGLSSESSLFSEISFGREKPGRSFFFFFALWVLLSNFGRRVVFGGGRRAERELGQRGTKPSRRAVLWRRRLILIVAPICRARPSFFPIGQPIRVRSSLLSRFLHAAPLGFPLYIFLRFFFFSVKKFTSPPPIFLSGAVRLKGQRLH